MNVDPSAALTQFLGNMPTFIAVILAWLHSNGRIGDINGRMGDLNARFNDLNARFGDMNAKISDHRVELKEAIKAEGAVIRAELRRVEEIMDARG